MGDAGIGAAAAIAKARLVESGWTIGDNVDRYDRWGTYLTGGTDRLCLMIRLVATSSNLSVAESLGQELATWSEVSDIEMRQRPDTGTCFVWFTFRTGV